MIESGSPSVDDALLERGVELREGHRDRRRPQALNIVQADGGLQPNRNRSPAMSSGFTIGLLLL